jgi:creatinine amidohydrolase/Fe(II)-dependent formamide hydrolase-like protein
LAQSVFMAELSWPAFAARTKTRTPFFLPVGATEQHGEKGEWLMDDYVELITRAVRAEFEL